MVGINQTAIDYKGKERRNMTLHKRGYRGDVSKKSSANPRHPNAMNLHITGGRELHGNIRLKTSKNAAVGLLCASLLNYGVTRFKAFPRIQEVYRIIEVLRSIGVQIQWLNNNDLEIHRPVNLDLGNLHAEAARKTRSVLMMIGPLMHDHTEFKIPYAGGCKLGARTVQPHLYALEEFGVDIVPTAGHYKIASKPKSAGRVTLYESGDTVTENALFAAARTETESILEYASANYMVQDVCFFLQKLGVKIDGVGSTVLRVRGLPFIKKNVTYASTEDPIEAMFFIAAAITTNSEITIERIPIGYISLELFKLKKMGLKYTATDRYKAGNGKTDLVDVTIHKHDGTLQALAEKVHPNVFPAGINADSLPYFVPIAAVANGRTMIHDWMYEKRAVYYTRLNKVGAQVELVDPHRAHVTGPTRFEPADLICPPALRPASVLLIGMLAANGHSTLRNIYTIQRGYEDLAERLNDLGACIEVFGDSGNREI